MYSVYSRHFESRGQFHQDVYKHLSDAQILCYTTSDNNGQPWASNPPIGDKCNLCSIVYASVFQPFPIHGTFETLLRV